MSSEVLSKVPDVDIDPEGVFKYILIRLHGPEVNGKETSKMIVRGYKSCGYHADIFDLVSAKLSEEHQEAVEPECVGGGRINHNAAEKKILVYGYSQGYGKADHKISVELLKKAYADYNVTWSDEGY